MKGLIERAERIARLRAVRATQRIAEAARTTLPADIGVSVEDEGIVLSGRNLGERALDDTRLRWLSRLMSEDQR